MKLTWLWSKKTESWGLGIIYNDGYKGKEFSLDSELSLWLIIGELILSWENSNRE